MSLPFGSAPNQPGYVFLYQSIPVYNHKVFKCKGQVKPDALEYFIDFYSIYEHTGQDVNPHAIMENERRNPNGFKVITFPKCHGDRCNEDGTEFIG